MNDHSIVVHLVPAHSVPAEWFERCLSPEESRRAEGFKDRRNGTLWAGYRCALRLILGSHLGLEAGQVPLTLGDHGKPILREPHGGLHFNLSHCDELALIAISTSGPVGVDLEPRRRMADLLECEAVFCHADETTPLPLDPSSRALQLMRIWTAKEAYLKAVGTGLLTPPDQVVVHWQEPETTVRAPGRLDGWLTPLDHPRLSGHIAHLCALQPVTGVRMLESLGMSAHLHPSA